MQNRISKIMKILKVLEAAYEGNIGIMELNRFYQIAGENEKRQLNRLINSNKTDKAWDLIEKVTGMRLKRTRSAA